MKMEYYQARVLPCSLNASKISCYLPSCVSKISHHDVVILTLQNMKKVICKLRTQNCCEDIIQFAPFVLCGFGPNEDLSLPNDLTISTADVLCMKSYIASSLVVNVILKSSKSLSKYKNNKAMFSKMIHNILRKFRIANECVVNTSSLSSDIASIHIHNLTIQNACIYEEMVGEVDEKTRVEIGYVKCKESSRSTATTLGGLSEVMSEIQSWILFEGKKNGILLVGPPGCGKSLLVKQICENLDIDMVTVAGKQSSSRSKFFKSIETAYTLAKTRRSLLFLDDIDCIFRVGKTSEREVLQFIQEIRKGESLINFTVIGSTNRPLSVHPMIQHRQILRNQILINVPTEAQRKEIINVYAGDRLDSELLLSLAKRTPGFVGDDLKHLCLKILALSDKENTDQFNEECTKLVNDIEPRILRAVDWAQGKPTIKPIIGLQQVEAQIQNTILMPFQNEELYKQFGLKPSKGIFLYGPPGCGKTSLVAKLAQENGFTFLSANGSNLLSSYVGESEKRVAELFHIARLAQPSIIFIDEIDGLFPSRGETPSSIMLSILTELLQELDGAALKSASIQGTSSSQQPQWDKIVICGATNNPDRIDEALLRPGRLETHIYIPLPSYEARLQILKIKTSTIELDKPALLEDIARETNNWSAAAVGGIFEKYILDLVEENKTILNVQMVLDKVRKTDESIRRNVVEVFEKFQNKSYIYFVFNNYPMRKLPLTIPF